MNRIAVSGFLAGALLLGLTACSKSQDAPGLQANAQAQAGDPANGNLAAPDQGAPPSDQTANTAPAPAYSQAPAYAPAQNDAPPQNYAPASDNSYADARYDASYDQPVYATEPPPPLPEYEQPPAPGDDYIWTPGYWAWQDADYYWVPGVWVTAPYVDALWTPPYWAFAGGRYGWHHGYWGPHIGFYGGINYGFGYTGHGYYGAYWNNGHVYYNRSVTNVNVSVVRNVYNYSVPSAGNTRISYNGGRGGINARPLPAEQAALREPHAAPVAAQVQHIRQAAGNREQFAAVNRGRPQMVAAAAPLATSYRTPAPRPAAVTQALERPNPGARPVPEARTPESRGQFQPGAQPLQRAEANQPNRPLPAAPENRMAGRPSIQENRVTPQPVPAARQPFPENRPAPQPAPVTRQPIPESRPVPEQPQRFERRPAEPPAPAVRPEVRPAPQPAARQPFPENRPAPQPTPVTRQPIPENRPAPEQPQRFERRPAEPPPAPRQEARPVPPPAPAPRQEVRPAPQPAPQPTARPAPQPVPQPAARPAAPPPAARPAPQPVPQPAARPAAPPPAARPAPGRAEENKEKR